MPTETAAGAVVEAPEALPAPEVEAPAESSPEQVEQEVQSFDDLPEDPNECAQILRGEKQLPEPKAEPEPEVEKIPEVEKSAQKEPEVLDLDKPLPNRIPTDKFTEEDEKAIQLQHILNRGKQKGDPSFVTLREAMKRLDAMEPDKAKPANPTPVEAISSKVTEAEAQLTALRQQKREAIEAGEPVTDIEEQIDLAKDAVRKEEIAHAIAQDRAERQQAQEVAAKTQTAQQQRAAVEAEVLTDFPSIRDKSTPLGQAFLEVIADMKQDDHPDTKVLETVSAPRHVLNEAIARLAKKDGISVVKATLKYAAPQAPEVAQPPAKPATAQPKKVLPASGSQATTPPKGAPTAEQVLEEVGDFNPLAAKEALFGNRVLTHLR